MADFTPGFQIAGFSLLRILSDRERSKVWLARGLAGELCAVKLQRPREPSALPGISARYERLLPLTRQTGLLTILSHGVTGEGWLWESLLLADNLPGLPPVTSEVGIQQYTPLTLRAWSTEHGPASANVVAHWGMRLAGALGVLHAQKLVHRDVKPTNIVFIQGEPCLGDYGLVGQPGASFDFSGTEGFQPLEGTSDAATDLFALGKTLYEAWTAADRLEFPSMPHAVLDAPDWDQYGEHLNEIVLRACHAEPRQRFHSATQMAEALSQVVSGQRPMSRRRWLAGAAIVVAATSTFFVTRRLLQPPARVIWRIARRKGFNVEAWQGYSGTVDWIRRRIYSIAGYKGACVLQWFDLDSFELGGKEIAGGPAENGSSILHPETRELWIIKGGGRGEVFSLDLDAGKIKSLGGGPNTERNYGGGTYWNPITRRVGTFGGYGHFAARNDRSEFNPVSGRWIELEGDQRSNAKPWRRDVRVALTPDGNGRRIYLAGGSGSPSGRQGERVPGLRGFNGQFHNLDDVWELNLEKNSWRKLVPLGHLDPQRLRAMVYHPLLKGLVIFNGIRLGSDQPGEPSALLLRPGLDRVPVELPVTGQPSRLAIISAWTLDPRNNEIIMLAEDGIFRLSVERV